MGVVAIAILSDCFCWWLVVESLTLAAVGWAPVRTMATSTTSPSTHTWAVRFLAYFDAPPLASPETALAASSGGAHDIEGRYLSSATAPPIFFCRAASARLESADHLLLPNSHHVLEFFFTAAVTHSILFPRTRDPC